MSSRPASRAPLCLAAALLGALASLATESQAAVSRPPTPADRAAFLAGHRSIPRLPVPPPLASAGQQDVDIEAYDLSIFLDVPGERIEATNRVTFKAAPASGSATELLLDLYDNMVVSAIDRDGTPIPMATVTHASNLLSIPLSPPLVEGAGSSRVTITYSGQPLEFGFGTLTFTTHADPPVPLAFTLSEPFLARGWWPCKDVPDDKALVSMTVEAPSEMVVVSNGVQEPIVPGRPGHSITTWRSLNPMSTYLVALGATNYVTWSDTYTSLDGLTTMPVPYWSFPEQEAAAREDWSITTEALRFYSSIFGEYPFLNEKYGQMAIPLWGAMEHQTATSYGAQLLTGDHRFDFVVVHELAHQWWGDLVGPRTFESIWLNEGFATYSEALWFEYRGGRGAYLDYMRAADVAQRGGEFPGTVHAPDDYFNGTVYDKGAWVLHMLRWVLGQPSSGPDWDALLQVMRAHSAEHPYGSAQTDEFEATTERVSGLELTWFFDQWVHRQGRPLYDVGWSAAPQAGGGFIVHVRVRQTQAGATYRMPVAVRLQLPGAPQDVLVDNSLAETFYEFPVAEAPSAVTWDPDGWILKAVSVSDVDADDDGWPTWLDGCPTVPNPLQEDANANGLQDACEAGLDFDSDGTPNQADCAAADAGVWTEPVGETLLFVGKAPTGEAIVSFQNPVTAPQRACVTDVAGGALGELRADRAFGRMSCLAVGHPAPEWTDPAVMPATGAYYLAWPFNGCGPASSPCR